MRQTNTSKIAPVTTTVTSYLAAIFGNNLLFNRTFSGGGKMYPAKTTTVLLPLFIAIVCGFAFGANSALAAEVNTVVDDTQPEILAPERVVLDATRTLQNESSLILATLTASNIQVEAEWDVLSADDFAITAGILYLANPEPGTLRATVIVADKFTALNSAYDDLMVTAVIVVDIQVITTGYNVFFFGKYTDENGDEAGDNNTHFYLRTPDGLTNAQLMDELNNGDYYIYYRGWYFNHNGFYPLTDGAGASIGEFNVENSSIDTFHVVPKSIVDSKVIFSSVHEGWPSYYNGQHRITFKSGNAPPTGKSYYFGFVSRDGSLLMHQDVKTGTYGQPGEGNGPRWIRNNSGPQRDGFTGGPYNRSATNFLVSEPVE